MQLINEMKITVIDAGFLDIPDSSLLHNVPHKKPLDWLVLFHSKKKIKWIKKCKKKKKNQVRKTDESYLGTAFSTVWAANELDMATSMFVAATIPTLESLQINKDPIRMIKIVKKIKFW